jgi:tetratricopeptide (TPR) repeat protein
VPSPFTRFLGTGLAALGLGLILSSSRALAMPSPSGSSGSSDQPQEEAPSLSDNVGDGLAKLKPLLDTKDWDGAVKLVDAMLLTAGPESYDRAFLLETKAKILTQKGDYMAAIEPLEGALNVADRHHFLTNKQDMDMLFFLSQLYYQQAEGEKKDRQEQVTAYEKAIDLVDRWLKIAPKPTEDIIEYYSRLLYAEAVAKDPAHPDPTLIRRAREQVEKTLLMTSHPKDSTYAFLLATLQQEQNYKRAAEIFELLLSKNPANKTYWQDLVNFYIVLSQGEKDPAKVRQYNVRAINTIERAQALGFLKTPRDNYLLFTFYYECGQYGTAADLLYAGLKDGSIDSDLDKWELLANSYQQINQDFKAIEVLQEAAKRFPKNGDLDLKTGGIYAQLDDGQKAFEFYKSAADKGGVPKGQIGYLYLALSYQAYELGKFEDAKEAIDKAIALKGGNPDHQQSGLKKAIEDAIKERDAKKAAAAPSDQQ